MYPRVNYEMSEAELEEILSACKPTPCMMIGSYVPDTPQENANRAWARLGQKLGFDYETVQPIPGKSNRYFSAVPSETEAQKAERLAKETEAKRLAEIGRLVGVIAEAERQLMLLKGNAEAS